MHKIINKPFALIIFALLVSLPRTQTATPAPVAAQNEDRIALYQALLDLQNPWTVMCIAAHPDDEDGTSLTVLRHKYGAHTVSVFSTFGEGGQNAIGPELYEELGAIRVRETMAAAKIQGSEPLFLGLKDFGFSKSADEAFKFWGHDEALRRMVQVIRNLRPDVIITNHSVANHDHGHHQATARLEIEAFDAAADPSRYPEQLKDGLGTWQVQRLFVRAGFGGSANAAQKLDDTGLVTIDPNEQDPVRGTTYAEQALAALQKHATQGPWPKSVPDMARFRNSADGKLPMIRYRLTREAKGVAMLPQDCHNFYDDLRLPEDIATQLQTPRIEGRPLTDFVDQRERVLETLLSAVRNHVFGEQIRGSKKEVASQERRQQRRSLMLARLNYALAVTSRVSLSLSVSNESLIPGRPASFILVITNGSTSPIRISMIAAGVSKESSLLLSSKRSLNTYLAARDLTQVVLSYATPSDTGLTVPRPAHLYDDGFAGKPIGAGAFVELQGVPFPLLATTLVDVVPAVEIADVSPSPLAIRPPTVGVSSAGTDIIPPPAPKFSVQLINHLDQPFKGEIVFGEENRKGETNRAVAFLPHQSLTLAISMPTPAERNTAAHSKGPSADSVWFSVRAAGSREIITTRRVPVVWANAHVARNLSVGYLRGFDFSLPHAFDALGVESKELSVDEVKTADLQKYSTIIIDNRVYESQPELIAANQRLLDYAKDGGTLVVFYHKSNEWNPDPRRNRPQLAPYPLTLGDARITDENALVTLTEADHPLLNSPNKIGQEDFEGWIQERGLYYPRDWDAHYHALLSTNDPGEKPLTGGLLVADYGRGHYIYTSMVWYRQLRAGVPGGYRMFANMISYGHQ